MKYRLQSILRGGAGLSLVSALILSCPAKVLPCHIEYSDWLVNVFRQQGVSLDKRVGNYTSLTECQAAIRQAVNQSGDPNLANNMNCIDCSQPVATLQPSTVSSPAATSKQLPGGVYQNAEDLENGEKERQAAFEREKQDLLINLRGRGESSSDLGLKTLGNSGSGLALKKGNVQAEIDAREASIKAQKAKTAKRDDKNLESELEQFEFENMNAEWMKKQKQIIEQRLMEPNKYASAIYKSLKTKAPPLPWKTFNELQPGDVLLIEGLGIAAVDNTITSGNKASKASHTVVYLKEVNGKKLFLDNQPFEGPRIISEHEFLKLYSPRSAEVAKLAQPLNQKEGKQLFAAAVEMAQKNRKEIADNWFGTPLLDTNYGAWGKENVVCSESDWALINAAGRNIPKSDDRIKVNLGIDFSPADYKNSQYFLVTPFW